MPGKLKILFLFPLVGSIQTSLVLNTSIMLEAGHCQLNKPSSLWGGPVGEASWGGQLGASRARWGLFARLIKLTMTLAVLRTERTVCEQTRSNL